MFLSTLAVLPARLNLKIYMNEKILILDFGSQYTQLIARGIRELNIYCEIQPCTKPDIKAIADNLPVLAVCYGAQLLAQQSGGEVGKSTHREYGRAHLQSLVH